MTLPTSDNTQSSELTNGKHFELTGFSLISVTGDDAQVFLQGQMTCDIRKLTSTQGSLAAFCNPKGRVISVLIIVRRQAEFVLILPSSLLDKVSNKLRMYVLRSKVSLQPNPQHLNLAGLQLMSPNYRGAALPTTNFAVFDDAATLIKLPGSDGRYFCLSGPDSTTTGNWPPLDPAGVDEWRYRDITAGLPWFDATQSEQHIPQTINVDHFDGISFEKGCYTGQEIIARTHYLGKAKRTLGLGECNGTAETDGLPDVLSETDATKVGEILAWQTFQDHCRMLVVFTSVVDRDKSLILSDSKRTRVRLIPFQ